MRTNTAITALLVACLSACGADDTQTPVNTANSMATNPGGKADSASASPGRISFTEGFSGPHLLSPLVAGGELGIRYDSKRMYHIIDGSHSMGYFATTFHCYGYGCCEVTFPEVKAYYRFNDQGDWTEQVLDDQGAADLTIPGDARSFEVWFNVERYNLKSWYCGCSGPCPQENYERAGVSSKEYKTWDSNYGKNFRFEVQASTQNTLTFGKLWESP
ncbi:MAG: hypothetical protein JRH20_26740, partial [Deltaproteobacteria bacterium]|nr:hypothetical protein [Deltaproteobacteria bacterium]